jgi:two-component system, cell cycle sensor histidine kinase and response regulator CckA
MNSSPARLRAFRNAPIKQKLRIVILATTAASLLLAGLGIVAADYRIFRRDLERDLSALANIVGDNSTAALVFDDRRVAAETLSALKARPHLVGACLYRLDGAPFASYVRHNAAFACPAAPERQAIVTTAEGLAVSHPVMLDGRPVGALFLLYDLEEVPERVMLFSGIVLLILVLSTGVVVVFSSGLRALIATPIARLAGAAQTVSESGDYGIRVPKESGDELGVLVDAFNEMLARIQARDEELQDARNSLATTLASIGDAVISTAGGRIVLANPAAAALLRWPEAELPGKPIDEVFRLVDEHSRRPIESPVDRTRRDDAVVSSSDNTLVIARDGAEIPIDHSAAPIRQHGRPVGVVLVFRDTTERRHARRDAAYLAAIVESSEDAIIGKTPEGVIQTWNAGAERVYGYTAAEVIGRRMLEILPPDRQHEESDILERMRSGQQMFHFDTVRVRKDGARIDVSLTISPIRDKSGQMLGISHVARDITEQKRAAEQLRHTQKLESLGVLAGGIAHDFNNLLTGILGNASLALEDLPNSPARQSIEAVVAASERAAQLAQQMLAYSGKGRFIVERVDLSAVVRSTLRMIRAAVPAGVELRTNLTEPLPPVEADPGQIQQLVMNIIINGAEAIPEEAAGSVTIVTRAVEIGPGHPELEPGRYVAFEVTDTGSGMDAATKARIFDPFFTTKFTGRGLGLAAVVGIVRGHRGTIDVDSAPGKGATFRILLPATTGGPVEKAPAAPQPPITAKEGGLVLVIDDESVVRKFARHTLERHGFTAVEAENGSRGVDIFRECAGQLRAVVLDLTMPVMSGEEALAQMKAIDGNIPVILSSGFNEHQAVQRFEGKGLAGFLQKPYRSDALVQKVREVLTRRS